jgi:signal transduction histidine kinase
MSRLPLRVRLVAGFVVAMLVLLTAAGAFVYWRVEYALDRGLDTDLDRATATITPLVSATGMVSAPDAADATGAGWQVLDSDGTLLDHGGAAATPMVGSHVLAEVGAGTLTRDLGRLLPGTDDPFRIHVTSVGSDGPYLLVAVRRNHRDEALRELLLQLTLAGLGALAVATLVGDRLARAALHPVERYRRRAEEISDGVTGLRLDVPANRDDEVTRLGHTLNDMLAAQERSLEHERRFVNDASHELRTPLTLLKSRLQLARRRSRSVEEHEEILDELTVDVGRLADLAEQLLTLGAHQPDNPGAADLGGTVGAIVEQRRAAHPDQADQLTLEQPRTPVLVAIDPHSLGRVVSNLVENAFAHGAPPVRVRVVAREGWGVVEVQDAGPGMPPELLEEATQRFTRAPEARSRPGAGLGLALVEQIVSGVGGELRLCSGGAHSRHGVATTSACAHSGAMTATVIVPLDRTSPGTALPTHLGS